MKLSTLNLFLLALCALILMACGGSGTPGALALDKTITVNYNNNSGAALTIFGPGAAGHSALPGGSATSSQELLLSTPASTAVWNFSAKNYAGNVMGTGSFTWEYSSAIAASALNVDVDSSGNFTFSVL